MLRRIAYAETRDGAASYTFTHGGGIWQVRFKHSLIVDHKSLKGRTKRQN